MRFLFVMEVSTFHYTSALCRSALMRKRWLIFVVPSVLLMMFYCFENRVTFRAHEKPPETLESKSVHSITEELDFEFSKVENVVWTTKTPGSGKTAQDESSTRLDAVCRLPVLDPFHSSVKSLIVDFGKLECGKAVSSFKNNTLTVHADNAVSVNYRIINRPVQNDFDVSLSHAVMMQSQAKKSRRVIPGESGCLLHKGSKKCIHPFGGESNPKEDTSLVFHSDCCFKRIEFKIKEDQTIVHVPSGLCLHFNTENNAVSLKAECTTKFAISNSTIRVIDSDFCLESNDGLPRNDEHVVAGNSCTQPFTLVSTQGRRFNGSAYVETDFIRVDIKQDSGNPDITEVHMQAAPKPDVFKRRKKDTGIPVNIGLIMFDSTSAANFIRQMPRSNAFLKTRPTVYMKGNTIVGDGTTAQLCAMLTGIAESDQPEARRSKPNSKPVDDWRWVFRDYRDHGYATMYTEDSPSLATFNYRLHGFKDPPTDHYGRYFWMEADRHSKARYCSGNDAKHRITFEYFLSLFRNYPENRKFAFINFSDLTHGNINSLKYADEDLEQLLKTMDNEEFLDETILFIFGDHGNRFGKMRQTLQGKLEERLPHMSITFPKWFPKKHPKLYESVQYNSHILTTPFDIYATLQHVLSYPHQPKDIHVGQSLFDRIDPKERTCAKAGVEDHWCPCLSFESVPLDESIVKRLSNHAVEYINKQIENEGKKVRTLCHELTLKEIKSASREMPNDKVQKFKRTNPNQKCDSCAIVLGDKDENTLTQDTVYQIQFITSPNNGFYETSIRVSGGEAKVQGSISRIDEYGHQPDCIASRYVHLRKYCFCKKGH